MNSELNESYYSRLYDDFVREQQRLSNDLKQHTDIETDKLHQNELKIISQFLQQILRIRNIKKQLQLKKNS
jgi:hypothetical protein